MKFANRRPPSRSCAAPSSVRSNSAALVLALSTRPVPECANMSAILPTEITDDVGPRGMTVAENAREVCATAQIFDELRRETGDRRREIAPIEGDWHAGDFPVPGRRVLALGDLTRASVGADRSRGRFQAGRHAAAR